MALFYGSKLAVLMFFAISGYVLTRSWDGRFGRFLIGRFVRLWPVYAVCLGAGFALSGSPVVWTQFFWFPLIGADDPIQIDPPAWSLCIEAFAMLAMPVIVWFAGGTRARLYFGLIACIGGALLDARLLVGGYFLAGAWLSRFAWRCRALEWWLPQFLGRISYPLYLSHWLVLRYAPGGPWLTVPLAFAVGWLLTGTIEAWSIHASRLARSARLPVLGYRGNA